MGFSLRIFKRMLSSSAIRGARVGIVGSGPAGFYAAMHLTKNLPLVNIDIYEKLPVPFGLIRYGVAPDHPEVKNVINQFTKVALQSNVNFYGNITIGKDINLSQLRQHYDAVLLTYGAEEDKTLNIENEDARNVFAARKFVGWYNGLPSDSNVQFDLSGNTAVIIGHGNVALDVARILLTPIDTLKKTDITEHALAALSESNIKEIYLVGRRGPLQVAFTIKELREQLKLENCFTKWRSQDFLGVSEIAHNLARPRKRLTELMLKSLNESKPVTDKECKFFKPVFFRSPKKFLVNKKKELTGVEFTCNRLVGTKPENQDCVPTDELEVINCSLALRSIGYKSVNIDNSLIFNHNGVLENERGRVLAKQNDNLAKLYAAGWLGTGPAGVILHTMGNAFQVAKTICEDLKNVEDKPKSGFIEVKKILSEKNIPVVDWSGWEKIDKYEIDLGRQLGKPREKVCSVKQMLEIAQ